MEKKVLSFPFINQEKSFVKFVLSTILQLDYPINEHLEANLGLQEGGMAASYFEATKTFITKINDVYL